MRTERRVTSGLLALVLAFGACGGDSSAGDSTFPPDTFAIIANADIGLGHSRVLIGIVEGGGRRLGSPDDHISVEVAPEGQPEATQTADATWTWIIDGAIGLYRVEFDLDTPGLWSAIVRPEIGDPLPATGFYVLEDTFAPAVGEAAPSLVTPTLATATIDEISTDPDPDPSFYQLSLDEALTDGRPTVIVFSSPAFCQTATCGPLLDIVKGVAPSHPDVDFLHLEIYTNLTDPDFAPTPENLSPTVGPDGWNLPSEPWVFVVDADGIVQARFEGVITPEELEAEL